jgi:hypothetical protein
MPWTHIGGVEIQLRSFLTMTLDDGEWLTSRSRRYILRKESRNTLNRRLGGTHSRSGRFGEEKNLLPLPGFELRTVQTVTQSLHPLRMDCQWFTQMWSKGRDNKLYIKNLTDAILSLFCSHVVSIITYTYAEWQLMLRGSVFIKQARDASTLVGITTRSLFIQSYLHVAASLNPWSSRFNKSSHLWSSY